MWWVVAGVTWAAEVPLPPPAEDFRSYLDQARFFLSKGWYDDAREQLEKAVSTEDGRLDAEAWFLLAKVRYELGDLQAARFAADRALVHSQDDQQAQLTHELLRYLDEKFGFVTVTAPYDGVSTVVEVELKSPIFDPDLKTWLNRLQERLHEPVVLPHELGLPAGHYAINGVEVDVAAGSRQVIAPKLHSAVGLVQALQLEVGVGATGYAGNGLGGLIPAPTLEVSAGFPAGPVVLGAMAAWAPQPFTTLTGTVQARLGGWSAGARAGFEVPGTDPLLVRPSLTARAAAVPGIELACAHADVNWTCARESDVRELYVYTTGVAASVGAEVLAEYLDRSRASGFGGGLKVGADWVVGTIPVDGVAGSPQGDVAFTVDGPRGFGAASWRVLAVGTYGF